MRFNIKNEFSPLKSVMVCYGEAVVDDGSKTLNHDAYVFSPSQKQWNRDLLLQQQEKFFSLLEKYGAKVALIPPQRHLWQQMFARDIGFVYGDRLFYSVVRPWKDRVGEIDGVLPLLNGVRDRVTAVEVGSVEGGDVLAACDELYIGITNRTTIEAVEFIRTFYPVRTFRLGHNVMHLDGCLTLLSDKQALIYPDIFQKEDLAFLRQRYALLEITLEEAHNLGGNIVMINPETVVVEKSQKRIADMLRAEQFKVELVEYSEPVALEGAFRCTTLPLERG